MAFKSLYAAKATVTGGRDGAGKTDDGKVDVAFDLPEGLGGQGGPGTNPEQLFALGYAACFEGAIAGVARAETLDATDVSIHSTVEIGKTSDGLGLQATLDVTLPRLDDDTAAQLVGKAHQVCPYSKATRGNIEVTLIANGKTLVG
ncbi:MAG: Ohr family peroxiredoxin [Solirubrobacteraceae bacterium]|nr:Ohr family peroxiredoxin [Patulibacter sp.]